MVVSDNNRVCDGLCDEVVLVIFERKYHSVTD